MKSVVLTFPIDKIVFPTVTLCTRDSRPRHSETTLQFSKQHTRDYRVRHQRNKQTNKQTNIEHFGISSSEIYESYCALCASKLGLLQESKPCKKARHSETTPQFSKQRTRG